MDVFRVSGRVRTACWRGGSRLYLGPSPLCLDPVTHLTPLTEFDPWSPEKAFIMPTSASTSVSYVPPTALPTAPPFPPFRQPDGTSDDPGPFRIDLDDGHDGNKLSAGVIAAIVVSIVVFAMILTALFAYFVHRRRKAKKVEIAMKEESISVVATASGALDPPPPYDEFHLARQGPGRVHPWDSRSDTTGSEPEDEDAIGSHATITDGMEPGRHGGSVIS